MHVYIQQKLTLKKVKTNNCSKTTTYLWPSVLIFQFVHSCLLLYFLWLFFRLWLLWPDNRSRSVKTLNDRQSDIFILSLWQVKESQPIQTMICWLRNWLGLSPENSNEGLSTDSNWSYFKVRVVTINLQIKPLWFGPNPRIEFERSTWLKVRPFRRRTV